MTDQNPKPEIEQQQPSTPSPEDQSQGLNVLHALLNFAIFVVIFVIGIGAFIKLKAMRKPPPKKPPEVRMLKVQAVTADTGSETISYTGQGTVAAKKEIKIIPEVTGKVIQVHPEFREGGTVYQGETLYVIDPVDLKNEEISINKSIEQLHTEISYLNEQKLKLMKELAVAADTLGISQEELERLERIQEQNAEAVAAAEINARRMTVEGNRRVVQQYQNNIALIDPGIEKIEKQIEVMEANRNKVDVNLGRTVYTAPFTGRVTGGKLDRGQFVAAGQPIAALQSVSVYEIPVPMSLEDWENLYPSREPQALQSSPVPVEVSWQDRGTGRNKCHGQVTRQSSQLNPRTRLADLIVEVSPGYCDGDLMPGMFVDVEFTGQKVPVAAAIPRRALRENDTVYVASDGKFKIKNVKVWGKEGESVLISSGLADGDLVITSVVDEPMPGTPVKILSLDGKTVSEQPDKKSGAGKKAKTEDGKK